MPQKIILQNLDSEVRENYNKNTFHIISLQLSISENEHNLTI